MKLFLRNNKTILLLILNILLFAGCITIFPDGSKMLVIGGTAPIAPPANYNELNLEDKQKIVTLENFNNVDNERINKINGKQLREELKKDDLAVVYFLNLHRKRL